MSNGHKSFSSKLATNRSLDPTVVGIPTNRQRTSRFPIVIAPRFVMLMVMQAAKKLIK